LDPFKIKNELYLTTAFFGQSWKPIEGKKAKSINFKRLYYSPYTMPREKIIE
jgi:hypothetical protein